MHVSNSLYRKVLATLVLVVALCGRAWAQGTLSPVEVPSQVKFAGMRLELDEDARAAVQKKVNGLMRSAAFYQSFVDRCNLYFPIIEEVFEEENLPEDFKFLALQESALIADAVSRSNAVGYWQFKDMTARELGLIIDKDLDERKNAAAASRAAAKYLKKNNYFMKNWVYTLLSYNLGLSGANEILDRSLIGATEMKLDKETHMYIIHFLAHKLAFEQAVGRNTSDPNRTVLVRYDGAAGQSLAGIAQKSGVDQEDLARHNRWVLGESVPKKGRSVFLVPVKAKDEKALLAKLGGGKPDPDGGEIASGGGNGKPATTTPAGKYPVITNRSTKRFGAQTVAVAKANGINAVLPDSKTDMPSLISSIGLSRRRFMKYNDLGISTELRPNLPYYLKKKKRKTPTDAEFHVAGYDQTLWEIGQLYGVKEKSLRKMNRMAEGEQPQPGRVLWLKKKRPRSVQPEMRDIGPRPEPKEDDPTAGYEVDPSVLDTILNVPETPATEPPVVAVGDGRFHVVQKGETLFAISRAYKISTVRLRELNKLPDDGALKTGQILIVKEDVVATSPTPGEMPDPLESDGEAPVRIDEHGNVITGPAPAPGGTKPGTSPGGNPATPGSTTASNATVHIVKAQENLYSIARIYKVSHHDIVKWNKLDPLQVLSVGQQLYVSDPAGGRPGSTAGEVATTPTPAKPPVTAPSREPKKHTVAAGETLYGISRKYGVPMNDVIAWNRLDNSTPLSVGQQLIVENPAGVAAVQGVAVTPQPTNTAAASEPVYHQVKANENLPTIAYRHNTTVAEIQRLNNLTASDILVEGQVLLVKDVPSPAPKETVAEPAPKNNTVVASGGTQQKTHTVKKGETVYGISRTYGITPDELRKWNGLKDNSLSVGQSLVVGHVAGASTAGVPAGTAPAGTSGSTNNGVSQAYSNNSGTYIGQTPPAETPKPAGPVFYEVQKGDTLYGIARKHNLTPNQLKILNEGLTEKLAIGQKIRVK
jgi:membrane-bound lytic murein transglycosylase D